MQDAANKFLKAFTMGAGGAIGGGLGSFAANAMNLNKMNGTKRGDTGEMSQGAQELAQKVQQNEMSGLQQRTANFMQNIKVYYLINQLLDDRNINRFNFEEFSKNL